MLYLNLIKRTGDNSRSPTRSGIGQPGTKSRVRKGRRSRRDKKRPADDSSTGLDYSNQKETLRAFPVWPGFIKIATMVENASPTLVCRQKKESAMQHATRKPGMTDYELQRFARRIRGVVLVTAVSVSHTGVESQEDVTVTEPTLYQELCQYAFWRARHLVSDYQDADFAWMTCSLCHVMRFRAVFGHQKPLAELFFQCRGRVAEIRFSFPEITR